MEPTTTTALILGAIAVITACVANLRIHSKCKNEKIGLDVSITKKFNEDLSSPRRFQISSEDDEDNEYSI